MVGTDGVARKVAIYTIPIQTVPIQHALMPSHPFPRRWKKSSAGDALPCTLLHVEICGSSTMRCLSKCSKFVKLILWLLFHVPWCTMMQWQFHWYIHVMAFINVHQNSSAWRNCWDLLTRAHQFCISLVPRLGWWLAGDWCIEISLQRKSWGNMGNIVNQSTSAKINLNNMWDNPYITISPLSIVCTDSALRGNHELYNFARKAAGHFRGIIGGGLQLHRNLFHLVALVAVPCSHAQTSMQCCSNMLQLHPLVNVKEHHSASVWSFWSMLEFCKALLPLKWLTWSPGNLSVQGDGRWDTSSWSEGSFQDRFFPSYQLCSKIYKGDASSSGPTGHVKYASLQSLCPSTQTYMKVNQVLWRSKQDYCDFEILVWQSWILKFIPLVSTGYCSNWSYRAFTLLGRPR